MPVIGRCQLSLTLCPSHKPQWCSKHLQTKKQPQPRGCRILLAVLALVAVHHLLPATGRQPCSWQPGQTKGPQAPRLRNHRPLHHRNRLHPKPLQLLPPAPAPTSGRSPGQGDWMRGHQSLTLHSHPTQTQPAARPSRYPTHAPPLMCPGSQPGQPPAHAAHTPARPHDPRTVPQAQPLYPPRTKPAPHGPQLGKRMMCLFHPENCMN